MYHFFKKNFQQNNNVAIAEKLSQLMPSLPWQID